MKKKAEYIAQHTATVADHSVSRIINQKALIDVITVRKGISKAALAKELGLSKPAVSKNVADLISMGLVKELGQGKSGKSGGRKPVMLRFNRAYRYICAVDLSIQEPICAVGDMSCKVLGIKKVAMSRAASEDEKKDAIAKTFIELMREVDLPLEKLGAIVISQPGVVNAAGEVPFPKERHRAWTISGLREYLQQRFDVLVLIENDVNLAAIGEMHFGTERHLKDLIYISCGVGLGSGIVIDGKLLIGHNRAAGELGEFLHKEGGRRVEEVVAFDGLLERIMPLYPGCKKSKITFSFLAEKVKSGDILVSKVIYETGRELGYIIYNCSVMVDIPTVILGGEYLNLGKALIDGIDSVLEQELPYRPRVLASGLSRGSILGSFVAGKDEILKRKIQSGG